MGWGEIIQMLKVSVPVGLMADVKMGIVDSGQWNLHNLCHGQAEMWLDLVGA
jgi:hypothetical protein